MGDEFKFGEFLNQMILQSGKSQEAVVSELRVKGYTLARTTLWRWCNGDTKPRRDKLPLLQHLPGILEMTAEQMGTYYQMLGTLIGGSQSIATSSVQPRRHLLFGEVVYFIGRKRELQLLKVALSKRQTILITGLAGIGKSTLARKLMEISGSEFTHGCDAIQIHAHQESPQIIFQVARRLGVPLPESQIWANIDAALDEICDWAYDIDMLFLLDNVENVAQIRLLLARLPRITWIITSRCYLYIPDVEPKLLKLQLPISDDASSMLMQYAHVSAVVENREQAREIVSRLGYLPIAVRTAAALVASGYVSDLKHLGQWLEDYGTALLQLDDWSITLFFDGLMRMINSGNAYQLFMLYGAFAKPMVTMEAFMAIAQASRWSLDGLDILVSLSLVQKAEENNLVMHPLVHEYAATQLQKFSQADLIYHNFAYYYADIARQNADRYDIIGAEIDNLLTAAEYAFKTDDMFLVLALWAPISSYFWIHMNWKGYCHFNERCLQAAQHTGDKQSQARALFNLAWYYLEADELDAATIWGHKARDVLEALGKAEQICRLNRFFGILHTKRGELGEAATYLHDAQRIIDAALKAADSNTWAFSQQMLVYHALAAVAQKNNDYLLAKMYGQNALAVCLQLNQSMQFYRIMIQLRLGDICYQLGTYNEATDFWLSVVHAQDLPTEKRLVAGAQLRLAQLAKQQNQLSDSLNWAHKAWQTYKAYGMLDRCKQTEQLIYRLSVDDIFDPATFLFIED